MRSHAKQHFLHFLPNTIVVVTESLGKVPQDLAASTPGISLARLEDALEEGKGLYVDVLVLVVESQRRRVQAGLDHAVVSPFLFDLRLDLGERLFPVLPLFAEALLDGFVPEEGEERLSVLEVRSRYLIFILHSRHVSTLVSEHLFRLSSLGHSSWVVFESAVHLVCLAQSRDDLVVVSLIGRCRESFLLSLLVSRRGRGLLVKRR